MGKYSFIWRVLFFYFFLIIGVFSTVMSESIKVNLRSCRLGVGRVMGYADFAVDGCTDICVIRNGSFIGHLKRAEILLGCNNSIYLHINRRQLQIVMCSLGKLFLFRGNNHMNRMTSVFSGHEPYTTGYSRQVLFRIF